MTVVETNVSVGIMHIVSNEMTRQGGKLTSSASALAAWLRREAGTT